MLKNWTKLSVLLFTCMHNWSTQMKLEKNNPDFRHSTFLCTRLTVTVCAFLSGWRYFLDDTWQCIPHKPCFNLKIVSLYTCITSTCLCKYELQILIFKHLTSASVRYSRDSLFFRRWASSTIIAPHGMEDKKASSFKHNYKERQGFQ